MFWVLVVLSSSQVMPAGVAGQVQVWPLPPHLALADSGLPISLAGHTGNCGGSGKQQGGADVRNWQLPWWAAGCILQRHGLCCTRRRAKCRGVQSKPGPEPAAPHTWHVPSVAPWGMTQDLGSTQEQPAPKALQASPTLQLSTVRGLTTTDPDGCPETVFTPCAVDCP